MILLTRYVSLGSLLGSAAMFPAMLLVLLVVPETPLPYVIYSAVGAALIWMAHADNIDRLLHGTERKFDLGLLAGKRSERRLRRSDAAGPRQARGRAPGIERPRSADDLGRGSTLVRRAVSRPAPRGRVGQPPRWRAEAVAAVDGLAAGRAERHLGLLAAARAGRGEHLARTAIAGAVATAAAVAASHRRSTRRRRRSHRTSCRRPRRSGRPCGWLGTTGSVAAR